jgi:hypothetical protein
MSQRRNRQKAHRLTHSRNQSGKVRANGADAVAVEEAGGTVLLIAARMTRQPVMGARAKNMLRPHRTKSPSRHMNRKQASRKQLSQERKIGPNQDMKAVKAGMRNGMSAGQSRDMTGTKDATTLAANPVTKIDLSSNSNSGQSQCYCLANPFPNISRMQLNQRSHLRRLR